MGFLYPNLIAGTRTQKMTGIVPEDLGDGRVGYVLRNDGTAEKSMYMPNVTLHTGTDYVLSFWSENTTNMSGTKWCVINQATGALAAYHIFDNQGPGGGISPNISDFGTMQRTEHSTSCASTTRGPRTEKCVPYHSQTSCWSRVPHRMRGHRQQGRCGLR